MRPLHRLASQFVINCDVNANTYDTILRKIYFELKDNFSFTRLVDLKIELNFMLS